MKPLGQPSVFDQLLGEWSFTREVSGQATMTGTATTHLLDADTALYQETVRIVLANGDTLHGHQRYLYKRSRSSGSSLSVLFYETQELFHDLQFASGEDGCLQAAALHVCAADRYQSIYTLCANGRLQVTHTVRGPRKDYVIQTFYHRQDAA